MLARRSFPLLAVQERLLPRHCVVRPPLLRLSFGSVRRSCRTRGPSEHYGCCTMPLRRSALGLRLGRLEELRQTLAVEVDVGLAASLKSLHLDDVSQIVVERLRHDAATELLEPDTAVV